MLIGALAFFNSCQKEQDDSITEIDANEISEYFIDDTKVTAELYESKQDDLILHQLHSAKTIEGVEKHIVEYRAFTTEDKYIAHGESIGLSMKEDLAFEDAMRTYAEKSGAIAEFDNTGVVPKHYIDYEQSMYDASAKKRQEAGKSAAVVTMFDYHNGGGSKIVMVKTYAWMPPGWKRRVSCVEFVGLGGSVSLYRKTFYRKRVARITDIGFKKINLYGGADNRTKSAFKHF